MDSKSLIAIGVLIFIVIVIALFALVIRLLTKQYKRAAKIQDQLNEILAQKAQRDKSSNGK